MCSSELKAFSGVVDALRAGGDLTGERAVLLADLARFLHISPLRQKTEIRRAVNTELLATLAARWADFYQSSVS
jgi:ENT domain